MKDIKNLFKLDFNNLPSPSMLSFFSSEDIYRQLQSITVNIDEWFRDFIQKIEASKIGFTEGLTFLTQFCEYITELLPQVKEELKNENKKKVNFEEFLKRANSIAEKLSDEEFKKFSVETEKRYKNILTKAAKNWVTPVDKLSNVAFDGTGKLYEPLNKFIGVIINSKKSKKNLLTMIKLDPGEEDNILINGGNKKLAPYDRIVHDAIVSLCVDAKNEYITPQMVYRTMTGNPNAKLAGKHLEAVNKSLEKLTHSRITIYADKELCDAYGIEKFSYSGTIISTDKIEITVKGKTVEAYRLLRKPVLYEYADKLNQISRFDTKLLATPINKNEETLILQDYLYRRILAMKGSLKLSHNILYKTIYNYLNLTASSEGALRKKKLKIRDLVKQILDYWKNEGFIKDYTENIENTTIVSITIKLS